MLTATGTPATGNITIGPYTAVVLSQTPGPRLSIVVTNGAATIGWPVESSGWVLEASGTLTGNPPPWLTVPVAAYQTNGAKNFFTTNAAAASAYYRLRSP
jgi:hypothetical protein